MAPPPGGVYSGSEAKGRRMIQNSVNQLFTFDNFDRSLFTFDDFDRSGGFSVQKSLFFSKYLKSIHFSWYFCDFCKVPIEDFQKNHDFEYCSDHEHETIR